MNEDLKKFNEEKSQQLELKTILLTPEQKKEVPKLLAKVFSRTDGFWNKVKNLFSKKGITEMIDVKSVVNAILDAKIADIKNAITAFVSGPQASELKDVVTKSLETSSSITSPDSTGSTTSPKDAMKKRLEIWKQLAPSFGMNIGKDPKSLKKNLNKPEGARLMKIIRTLQEKGLLKEALRRGAIKLYIINEFKDRQ
jgi:hypothetical protein